MTRLYCRIFGHVYDSRHGFSQHRWFSNLHNYFTLVTRLTCKCGAERFFESGPM